MSEKINTTQAKHIRTIVGEPLNRLRIEFSHVFMESKVSQSYFEQLLPRMKEIFPDKQLYDKHLENLMNVLSTGDIKFPINLNQEESQFFWGAVLAYISSHPEIQQRWDHKNQFTKISESTLWKRIAYSSEMRKEFKATAFILKNSLRNPETRMLWGEPLGSGYPNIGYCFIPEQNIIIDDMLWSLIGGTKNALPAINHEIAHSQGTIGIPQKIHELEEQFETIRQQIAETEQTQQNTEEIQKLVIQAMALQQEAKLRFYIYDELENMYANRYAINAGGDADKLALNILETCICGSGEQYLSEKKSLEDFKKELTPSKQINHIKRAARYSFFCNNGLIRNTLEDWHSIGVYPECIVAYDKDGKELSWQDSFKKLRDICDQLEKLQPSKILRLLNQGKYTKQMKEMSQKRQELSMEFFDSFVLPYVKDLIQENVQDTAQQLNEQMTEEDLQKLQQQMQKVAQEVMKQNTLRELSNTSQPQYSEEQNENQQSDADEQQNDTDNQQNDTEQNKSKQQNSSDNQQSDADNQQDDSDDQQNNTEQKQLQQQNDTDNQQNDAEQNQSQQQSGSDSQQSNSEQNQSQQQSGSDSQQSNSEQNQSQQQSGSDSQQSNSEQNQSQQQSGSDSQQSDAEQNQSQQQNDTDNQQSDAEQNQSQQQNDTDNQQNDTEQNQSQQQSGSDSQQSDAEQNQSQQQSGSDSQQSDAEQNQSQQQSDAEQNQSQQQSGSGSQQSDAEQNQSQQQSGSGSQQSDAEQNQSQQQSGSNSQQSNSEQNQSQQQSGSGGRQSDVEYNQSQRQSRSDNQQDANSLSPSPEETKQINKSKIVKDDSQVDNQEEELKTNSNIDLDTLPPSENKLSQDKNHSTDEEDRQNNAKDNPENKDEEEKNNHQDSPDPDKIKDIMKEQSEEKDRDLADISKQFDSIEGDLENEQDDEAKKTDLLSKLLNTKHQNESTSKSTQKHKTTNSPQPGNNHQITLDEDTGQHTQTQGSDKQSASTDSDMETETSGYKTNKTSDVTTGKEKEIGKTGRSNSVSDMLGGMDFPKSRGSVQISKQELQELIKASENIDNLALEDFRDKTAAATPQEQTTEDYEEIDDNWGEVHQGDYHTRPVLISRSEMQHSAGEDARFYAKGSLNSYERIIADHEATVLKVRQLLRKIIEQQKMEQAKKSLSHKKEDKMELLPTQGADKLSIQHQIDLVKKKQLRDPSLSIKDFERFKNKKQKPKMISAQDVDVPSVDVGILIDGSGSMNGSPFETALTIGCILFEATRKIPEINIYIYMMGQPRPLVIGLPENSQEEIACNLDSVRRGQGGCNDHLTPAVERFLKDVAERKAKEPKSKSGFQHIFSITDGGNCDYGERDVNKILSTLLDNNPYMTFDSFFIDVGYTNYTKGFILEKRQAGCKRIGFVDDIHDISEMPQKICEMLTQRMKHSKLEKASTNMLLTKIIKDSLSKI